MHQNFFGPQNSYQIHRSTNPNQLHTFYLLNFSWNNEKINHSHPWNALSINYPITFWVSDNGALSVNMAVILKWLTHYSYDTPEIKVHHFNHILIAFCQIICWGVQRWNNKNCAIVQMHNVLIVLFFVFFCLCSNLLGMQSSSNPMWNSW